MKNRSNNPFRKVKATEKVVPQRSGFYHGPSVIRTSDVIREVASKKIKFEKPSVHH
jgi:hypothetical protein